MDSVDKFFRESHYNIIRVLLGINGLWPYHTTGRRYAIYFTFLLVLGSGMTFEVYRESNYHEILYLFFWFYYFVIWKVYEYYMYFSDNYNYSDNYFRIRVWKHVHFIARRAFSSTMKREINMNQIDYKHKHYERYNLYQMQVLGITKVWPDSLEVIDCLPVLVLGTVSITKLVCAIRTLPEVRK